MWRASRLAGLEMLELMHKKQAWTRKAANPADARRFRAGRLYGSNEQFY